MRRYRITLTERQLMLVARCVEDLHRFASGQPKLTNTMMDIDAPSDKRGEVAEHLNACKAIISPELKNGGAYGWNGVGCPNESQRRFIAETYCIYREIYHQIGARTHREWVYGSPTPTCKEGGDLPVVTEYEVWSKADAKEAIGKIGAVVARHYGLASLVCSRKYVTAPFVAAWRCLCYYCSEVGFTNSDLAYAIQRGRDTVIYHKRSMRRWLACGDNYERTADAIDVLNETFGTMVVLRRE